MSRPKFCPNCGQTLSEPYTKSTVAFKGVDGGGYDCYCAACKWSGDILPDDEAEGEP